MRDSLLLLTESLLNDTVITLSTRVYTYNMPDAIDARLASLTLSGVDIGEF